MECTDVKYNCFGVYFDKDNNLKCNALNHLNCQSCKFFKTKEEYNISVAPLRHKNS